MKPFTMFAISIVLLSQTAMAQMSGDSLEDQSDDSLSNRFDVVYSGDPVGTSDLIAKATYQLAATAKDPRAKGLTMDPCSATLIDQDILMTAGHCLSDPSQVQLWVKYTVPGSVEKKMLKVVQIVEHKNFSMTKDENGNSILRADIALLRLESKLPGGIPALLPNSELKISQEQDVTIAGFGANGHEITQAELLANPQASALLQNAKAHPKMTAEEQKQLILKLMNIAAELPLLSAQNKARLVQNGDGNLSKMQLDGALHVCHGDSGGPTYLRSNKRLVVIGVHSTGTDENCDNRHHGLLGMLTQSNFLAEDTYVPNYLSWIKAQVQAMHAQKDI